MTVQEEWDAMLRRGKIPVFEVEVVSNATGESEWILFDIRICDGYIEATHVALSKEEEESEFVATKVVEIDEGFNLDWHLYMLYRVCIEAIMSGGLYDLKQED